MTDTEYESADSEIDEIDINNEYMASMHTEINNTTQSLPKCYKDRPSFDEMKKISREYRSKQNELLKQMEAQQISEQKAYQEFINTKVSEYISDIDKFIADFKAKTVNDLIDKFYEDIKIYLVRNTTAH